MASQLNLSALKRFTLLEPLWQTGVRQLPLLLLIIRGRAEDTLQEPPSGLVRSEPEIGGDEYEIFPPTNRYTLQIIGMPTDHFWIVWLESDLHGSASHVDEADCAGRLLARIPKTANQIIQSDPSEKPLRLAGNYLEMLLAIRN